MKFLNLKIKKKKKKKKNAYIIYTYAMLTHILNMNFFNLYII